MSTLLEQKKIIGRNLLSMHMMDKFCFDLRDRHLISAFWLQNGFWDFFSFSDIVRDEMLNFEREASRVRASFGAYNSEFINELKSCSEGKVDNQRLTSYLECVYRLRSVGDEFLKFHSDYKSEISARRLLEFEAIKNSIDVDFFYENKGKSFYKKKLINFIKAYFIEKGIFLGYENAKQNHFCWKKIITPDWSVCICLDSKALVMECDDYPKGAINFSIGFLFKDDVYDYFNKKIDFPMLWLSDVFPIWRYPFHNDYSRYVGCKELLVCVYANLLMLDLAVNVISENWTS